MSAARKAPWLSRLLGPRAQTPPVTPVRAAGQPAEVPTPITRERVADYLASRGYTFRLDEDGDLTGTWDGNRFWFMLLGAEQDIVQIRGRWHRPLAESGRMSTLQIINDWNRERIWPKAYVRSEGQGLALYTELSVDFGPGATRDQLNQIVACGLGTSVQLFTSVADMLPPESQDDIDDVDDNEGPDDDLGR